MAAWLFLRGKESIRIIRSDAEPTLVITGPGFVREERRFGNAIELAAHMIAVEGELRGVGWTLDRFRTERRKTRRRTGRVNGRRADDHSAADSAATS